MTEIVVCLKLVSLEPAADADDQRFVGISAADAAALETGLRLAAELGVDLAATSVGGPEVDAILTDALAVGADVAVRIPAAGEPSSTDVAAAIAATFPDAELFLCGDYSMDRGSGSVPAFLAHWRQASQALGLTQVDVAEGATPLRAVRRLDQARREVLSISFPAVLSLEGGLRLRRAGLPAVLAARSSEIELGLPLSARQPDHGSVAVGPYRPRTRVVPAPTGSTIERIRSLTGADVERTPPQLLELDPDDAADLVIERLAAWGHLPET